MAQSIRHDRWAGLMGRRGPKPRTLMAEGAKQLALVAADRVRSSWPDPKWQVDPVGFARDILGLELWSRQREMLEAIRDYPEVAVKSGRRVAKSYTLAIAALWFYCSFPEARVIMTAPTASNLTGVLWKAVQMLHARSGICLKCRRAGLAIKPCDHSQIIDGAMHTLVQSGLKSEDFREIIGVAVDKPEAMQGIAGINLLFLIDEASGVESRIFDVIKGNRAGGGRMVMAGNPTRTHGTFYEAFTAKRDLYKTLTIRTQESPNITAHRIVVPGLADDQYLKDRSADWGIGSPNWRVHVEGEFALEDGATLFSLATIQAAEERWVVTMAEGRLYLGVDVAGEGHDGDETALSWRRGLKQLGLVARRGMSPYAILEEVLAVMRESREAIDAVDPPAIVIDRDGAQGARVYDVFRAYLNAHDNAFRLIGFRGADPPSRMRDVYKLQRDLLFANLKEWLQDGGAIITDPRLEGELSVLKWIDNEQGKQVLIRKSAIRDALGRSPDRLDALALCVWGEARVRVMRDQTAEEPPSPPPAAPPHEDDRFPEATFNPFDVLGQGYRQRNDD